MQTPTKLQPIKNPPAWEVLGAIRKPLTAELVIGSHVRITRGGHRDERGVVISVQHRYDGTTAYTVRLTTNMLFYGSFGGTHGCLEAV